MCTYIFTIDAVFEGPADLSKVSPKKHRVDSHIVYYICAVGSLTDNGLQHETFFWTLMSQCLKQNCHSFSRDYPAVK